MTFRIKWPALLLYRLAGELLIMCDAPPRPRCRQCGDHLQPAPCLLSPHTSIVVTVEVVRGRQIATVTTAPSSCAVHTTRAPAFHLQTDRWYTGLEKNRLKTVIMFVLFVLVLLHLYCCCIISDISTKIAVIPSSIFPAAPGLVRAA